MNLYDKIINRKNERSNEGGSASHSHDDHCSCGHDHEHHHDHNHCSDIAMDVTVAKMVQQLT